MIRLPNILIKAIFLGIFRDISIGLHSRDFHTPTSAHYAVGKFLNMIGDENGQSEDVGKCFCSPEKHR